MTRLQFARLGQRLRWPIFLMACMLSSVLTFAQSQRTGKVTDEAGKPIPGVSVTVKDNAGGTTTNEAGEFSINAAAGQVLQFSSVSFESKDVLVGSGTQIAVSLSAKSGTLSDVVVVGYGTQKRVNMTGAVGTVDKKKIEDRPVANAMAALQGVAPGVTVTRSNGTPGGEGYNLQIRGFSSVNGSPPLVLVDGAPGSLISVNPNDIENISILKDAAAASIYGARAAGGVVLVTTKRGTSGKVTVNYNGKYASMRPSNVPGRLHSWQEAEMANESRINAGQAAGYTAEQIEWMKNPDINYVPNPSGSDYLYFYDLDQTDLILRDQSPMWDHNVSMRGGGARDNFFFSTGYYKQQGVFTLGPDKTERINARFNYSLAISKILSLDTRLAFRQSNTLSPSVGNARIFSNLYTTRTLYPTFFPGTTDRYINDNSGNFAYALLKEGGTGAVKENEGNAQIALKAKDIVKGLTLSATYSPRLGVRTTTSAIRTIPRYNLTGIGSYMNNPNSYTKTEYKITSDNIQLIGDYVWKLGSDHDFHVMGGYAYEDERIDQTSGRAANLATNDFFTLNTGDPLQYQASEFIDTWGLESYFGRFNYAFRNKYLFEANYRHDGSSKLAPVNRWKNFPSVSVGWRMAQEEWFRNALPFFNEFKLRGSWGKLGNSDGFAGDNYAYIALLTAGQPYPFNGVRNRSYYQGRLASPDKVWETITTSDVGIDIAALSNRLNISADYFVKRNDDMLAPIQISSSIGIATGTYNVADMKTTGWELSIGWRDRIGKDFSYYINANIGDSKNKVISYNGQTAIVPGINGIIEGMPLNTVYGYQAAGYYRDAADVAANPTFSSAVGPGDIKYIDVNKDGKINAGLGRLSDHGDLVNLGNSTPRYSYGFDFGFSYKGFDFSAMFQGIGQRKLFVDPTTLYPYTSSWIVPMDFNLDYWKPDNQEARFPRMFIGGAQNTLRSSHWVMNGAYLRLKNVQFGYNLPQQWIRKTGLTNAKIYFAGQDLWEVSQMWLKTAFDPETPDNAAWQYPFFRTISFGVNLTF
jgi:TonB-linked SusC/RagA family outer membrane protein